MVVLFAAATLAVYKAARHPAVALSPDVVQLIEGDEMAEESIYVQDVLPLQEKRHPELVARIRAKARELAAGGVEITTDDIHKAMPLPSGIDGRILGTAFHPRAAWIKTGYTPSVRKENHSRPIARWRLKTTVS